MSIDGYIEKVTKQQDGSLLLELTGRAHGEDGITMYAPAGQSRLSITNATWTPQVGFCIWGDASGVQIIDRDGVPHEYRREGYTTLLEDFKL